GTPGPRGNACCSNRRSSRSSGLSPPSSTALPRTARRSEAISSTGADLGGGPDAARAPTPPETASADSTAKTRRDDRWCIAKGSIVSDCPHGAKKRSGSVDCFAGAAIDGPRSRHMPFGMGFGELVLILLIVVVVFGATKLPQLGDGLGKAIKNFKRSIN